MRLNSEDFERASLRGMTRKVLSALRVLAVAAGVLLGGSAAARTIIVAADSTGDYLHVTDAALAANAGDSILVRDGEYSGYLDRGEEFVLGSGVVLFAEHPGAVVIWESHSSTAIELRGSAQMSGLIIQGSSFGIGQDMVSLVGGPARVINCEFRPAARFGWQITFRTTGHAPQVERCRFYLSGSNWVASNQDSTHIWMPNNYYGSLDTAWIHHFIWDSSYNPEVGAIAVSPVADTFAWLSVRPTGAEPAGMTFDVQLFPNPTRGDLGILLSRPAAVERVDIYNLLGELVWTSHDRRRMLQTHMSVHLPLSSGSYFICLSGAPMAKLTSRFTVIK